MSFLDYLLNGSRQRQPQGNSDPYIPSGMPIDIATSRNPVLTPNMVQNYNMPPLAQELARRPVAPQMTMGGTGQPWANQAAPNGISPSAAPNFVGEGTSAPWMGGFPSAGAPGAPAGSGGASRGVRPPPGFSASPDAASAGVTGNGWELFKHQDDMGRSIYDTRPIGTGDRSQVAAAGSTPGMGFLNFITGMNGGKPGAAPTNGLQGPTPNGASLDQVAGPLQGPNPNGSTMDNPTQAAASGSIADFGNTALGGLFKAWGIGL